MKTIFQLVCISVLLFIGASSEAQVPLSNFKSVNFECGGYVTAVFPVKHNPSSINQQVLYAKTDVGGVYRSADNGATWGQVACYFNGQTEANAYMMWSEYIIGSLAVHPTNTQTFIVAWGSSEKDAEIQDYNCLWRSTDAGMTFNKCVFTGLENHEKPWFNGDNYSAKLGGECMIYDPRYTNGMYLFLGGIPKTGQKPRIYQSTDGGQNWSQLISELPNSIVNETVLCLAMDENVEELWVGTTRAVYRSTDFQNFTEVSSAIPNARRILLGKNGNNVYAYIAGGTGNGKVYRFINGVLDNTLADFPGYIAQEDDNYISLLAWLDNAKTKLIASRWNRPTARLDALTSTGWSFDAGNACKFYYDAAAEFPKHQFATEIISDNFMYTGLNQLVRNPNPSFSNYWYISGGAGLRISDGVALTSNYSFENKDFKYSVKGQSMPVVNDIAFEPFASPTSKIYMSIADWATGYTNNYNNYYNNLSKLDYDNQVTRLNGTTGNSVVAYVSKTLFKNDETSRTYHLGWNQYYGGTCAMYIKSGSNVTVRHSGNHSWSLIYTKPNRFFTDAVIYNHGIYHNKLITLIGNSKAERLPPNSSEILGIFHSIDEGLTFSNGSFTLASNDNFSTEHLYENSMLPGPVNYQGSGIPYLFESQHNLVSRNQNKYAYLYLPKLGSAPEGGGIFVTQDGGSTWRSDSINVLPFGERFGGCLKYPTNDRLVLAVQNSGLYKGTINQSNGNVSWVKIPYFKSAEQVEVSGNQWAVFGIEAGNSQIKAPRLYKGIEDANGNITWSLLQGRIRGVRDLKFHPTHNNQLWVATTGQGVLILPNFAPATNPAPLIITANETINTNSYYDLDIIVEDGGHLTLNNNIFFDMGPNRKIQVKPGGKITIDNVKFNHAVDAEFWKGIEIESPGEMYLSRILHSKNLQIL